MRCALYSSLFALLAMVAATLIVTAPSDTAPPTATMTVGSVPIAGNWSSGIVSDEAGLMRIDFTVEQGGQRLSLIVINAQDIQGDCPQMMVRSDHMRVPIVLGSFIAENRMESQDLDFELLGTFNSSTEAEGTFTLRCPDGETVLEWTATFSDE